MSEKITIALSKGKLLPPTLEIFRRAGFGLNPIADDDRRLVFESPADGLTLLLVRASDVPAYVEYGSADVGVVGKDVLLEQAPNVYEPVDLGIGTCKIAVAMLKGWSHPPRLSSKIRVATKYPRITERHFNQQGTPVEIIKLYGSIELAPIVGLAERIVDLVSSGRTLKAHHLVETEVIAWSSARLIVNRASLKMKPTVIAHLIDQLRRNRPSARIEKGAL